MTRMIAPGTMIALPRSKARTASRAHCPALIWTIDGIAGASKSEAFASNSVATGPGQSWLTVRPRGASSTRNDSVSPVTKCLVATYPAKSRRLVP